MSTMTACASDSEGIAKAYNVLKVFQRFDEEQSGRIELAMLHDVFSALEMSRGTIKMLLEYVEVDANGLICYDLLIKDIFRVDLTAAELPIQITMASGQGPLVYASPQTQISALKIRIERETSIPVPEQQLIAETRALSDDVRVGDMFLPWHACPDVLQLTLVRRGLDEVARVALFGTEGINTVEARVCKEVGYMHDLTWTLKLHKHGKSVSSPRYELRYVDSKAKEDCHVWYEEKSTTMESGKCTFALLEPGSPSTISVVFAESSWTRDPDSGPEVSGSGSACIKWPEVGVLSAGCHVRIHEGQRICDVVSAG